MFLSLTQGLFSLFKMWAYEFILKPKSSYHDYDSSQISIYVCTVYHCTSIYTNILTFSLTSSELNYFVGHLFRSQQWYGEKQVVLQELVAKLQWVYPSCLNPSSNSRPWWGAALYPTTSCWVSWNICLGWRSIPEKTKNVRNKKEKQIVWLFLLEVNPKVQCFPECWSILLISSTGNARPNRNHIQCPLLQQLPHLVSPSMLSVAWDMLGSLFCHSDLKPHSWTACHERWDCPMTLKPRFN